MSQSEWIQHIGWICFASSITLGSQQWFEPVIYTFCHTLHSTSLHYPTGPNVLTVLFVRGHCHPSTHQSSSCGFSCNPVVKLFERPLCWCRHHKHTWGRQTVKVPEKSQSIKNSPALTLTPSGSTAEAWRWVIMTTSDDWLARKQMFFSISVAHFLEWKVLQGLDSKKYYKHIKVTHSVGFF